MNSGNRPLLRNFSTAHFQMHFALLISTAVLATKTFESVLDSLALSSADFFASDGYAAIYNSFKYDGHLQTVKNPLSVAIPPHFSKKPDIIAFAVDPATKSVVLLKPESFQAQPASMEIINELAVYHGHDLATLNKSFKDYKKTEQGEEVEDIHYAQTVVGSDLSGTRSKRSSFLSQATSIPGSPVLDHEEEDQEGFEGREEGEFEESVEGELVVGLEKHRFGGLERQMFKVFVEQDGSDEDFDASPLED